MRNDVAETGEAARKIALGPLGEDISFLTRVLRAQLRGKTQALYDRSETSPGEIVLLTLIGCNPGISQNDLAGAVVLKKSAMTKLMADLEDKGLIERRKKAGDRRFNAVHLTEAGEAKRAALDSKIADHQDNLLAPFDANERATLFSLLLRLSTHLDRED